MLVALGWAGDETTIPDLGEELGSDSRTLERAERMIRNLCEQGDDALARRRGVVAVIVAAYCSMQPGRLVVCGQDQLALYMRVQRELSGDSAASPGPIGLFLPGLPIVAGAHVLLDDSRERAASRISLALESLPTPDDQRRFARDLVEGIRRAAGIRAHTDADEDRGVLSFGQLRDRCLDAVDAWLGALRLRVNAGDQIEATANGTGPQGL